MDSVFYGKLHEKNKGPFLVVSCTGPVNYEIQEIEGGRKFILHVDKLYPYVPEDDEVLSSWLPLLPQHQDVSCQCDVNAQGTASTACQVDMQPNYGSKDQFLYHLVHYIAHRTIDSPPDKVGKPAESGKMLPLVINMKHKVFPPKYIQKLRLWTNLNQSYRHPMCVTRHSEMF